MGPADQGDTLKSEYRFVYTLNSILTPYCSYFIHSVLSSFPRPSDEKSAIMVIWRFNQESNTFHQLIKANNE